MGDDGHNFVGLFGGAGSGFVKSMQNILEQNGIPSVHISGGDHKMPRPTGVQVRKCDFDRAIIIYKEYKAYYDQSDPKEKKKNPEKEKEQKVIFFVFFGIVIAIIAVFVLTNLR